MNLFFILKPKSTIVYLPDNITIRQGLEKFKAHSYTAVPVIDKDGKYVGTVSEGDFLWDILNKNTFDIKEKEQQNIKSIIRKNYNPAIKVEHNYGNTFWNDTKPKFYPSCWR